MKNTVLAFIGLLVITIGMQSVMTLSERGIRRLQLEYQVSRSMKEAFHQCYVPQEKKNPSAPGQGLLWKLFLDNFRSQPSGKGHYKIKLIQEDVNSGLLCVLVEEHYPIKKGKEGIIFVKKAMIKESEPAIE